MSDYGTVATDEVVEQTVTALSANGFKVQVANTLAEAKDATLKLLPEGSEVFTATSATLDEAGIASAINESGEYDALRPKLTELSDPSQGKERKKLTAGIDYIVASAAAVTRDGKIMVASGTGSQLGPETYGANHVIYVVSAMKIVDDIADGIKRIEEYAVPQESARIAKVYNSPGAQTTFSRLFVYNKDHEKRVDVILVKEKAGF